VAVVVEEAVVVRRPEINILEARANGRQAGEEAVAAKGHAHGSVSRKPRRTGLPGRKDVRPINRPDEGRPASLQHNRSEHLQCKICRQGLEVKYDTLR
jgi:hypothetical protein